MTNPSPGDLTPADAEPWHDPRAQLHQLIDTLPHEYNQLLFDYVKKLLETRPATTSLLLYGLSWPL